MSAWSSIFLVLALLLFGTHRLPAPIQEIPESPTPAPAESVEPEPERLAKIPAANTPAVFIESFVKALSANEINTQLPYYADHLEYYELGQVTKDVVRKDLQHDITTWPSRVYSIEGTPKITPNDNGFIAEFRMTYTLANSNGRSTGTLQMTVRLKLEGQALRIAEIQKKVILAKRQK